MSILLTYAAKLHINSVIFEQQYVTKVKMYINRLNSQSCQTLLKMWPTQFAADNSLQMRKKVKFLKGAKEIKQNAFVLTKLWLVSLRRTGPNWLKQKWSYNMANVGKTKSERVVLLPDKRVRAITIHILYKYTRLTMSFTDFMSSEQTVYLALLSKACKPKHTFPVSLK